MKTYTSVDRRTIGTQMLAQTSKMPSSSISLPAVKACPGMVTNANAHLLPEQWSTGLLRNPDGSFAPFICDGCYADPANGGTYGNTSTIRAEAIRFDFILDALRDTTGVKRPFALAYMLQSIRARKAKYEDVSVFRVHDSGDLFSPAYVDFIYDVIAALPEIVFWIPTRMYHVANPKLQAALERLLTLPNVVLRPSAFQVGQDAPEVPGYAGGTTVYSYAAEVPDGVWACPSSTPEHDGQCLDCRMCFGIASTPEARAFLAKHRIADARLVKVGYIVHGKLDGMVRKHTTTRPLPVIAA